MKNLIILFSIILAGFSAFAQTAEQQPVDPEIGITEKLDEFLPDDIVIINVNGEREYLSALLDKPTVLAIVYYRCPGICSPFMASVAEVIQNSNLEIGKDYQVLNISFDPTEGPILALANQNSYHMLVKKEFDPNGYRFFTTDSLNSRKLTNAVGFNYKRQGLDFVHTSAMIFVSEKGKITRYLHGTYFLPMDLKLAVVETAEGKSGPSLSRVLSYCYSYNPQGQAYVFNFTKVAGTIIMLFAITIFLFLALKPRKQKVQN